MYGSKIFCSRKTKCRTFAPHGTGTGDGQVTPLNHVKFDMAARTLVATNMGWTRTARKGLKDEGLVKFR